MSKSHCYHCYHCYRNSRLRGRPILSTRGGPRRLCPPPRGQCSTSLGSRILMIPGRRPLPLGLLPARLTAARAARAALPATITDIASAQAKKNDAWRGPALFAQIPVIIILLRHHPSPRLLCRRRPCQIQSPSTLQCGRLLGWQTAPILARLAPTPFRRRRRRRQVSRCKRQSRWPRCQAGQLSDRPMAVEPATTMAMAPVLAR